MITARRQFGNQGEDLVAAWLIEHGYSILNRNYQTHLGEIDIIATKQDVVAFIEVKTRKLPQFPIEATITYTKQKRIARAATTYILANNINNKVLRFDVATVTQTASNNNTISYIKNAFTI